MLYYLLTTLAEDVSFFNVFRYLTTRIGGAILTGLLIAFILESQARAWATHSR
jgi:phospho-N-acetylmuramoyl-pentapeptide-transferase